MAVTVCFAQKVTFHGLNLYSLRQLSSSCRPHMARTCILSIFCGVGLWLSNDRPCCYMKIHARGVWCGTTRKWSAATPWTALFPYNTMVWSVIPQWFGNDVSSIIVQNLNTFERFIVEGNIMGCPGVCSCSRQHYSCNKLLFPQRQNLN